jgi:hypothetical protein
MKTSSNNLMTLGIAGHQHQDRYRQHQHSGIRHFSLVLENSGTVLHCKEKMPNIWNKCSKKRNIGALVPISTFMCLWANYIFPRWVCLFCWRNYVDRSWEYIIRSQTHECGNWNCSRAIPRKGIHKWVFRCSVGSKRLQNVTIWAKQFFAKIPIGINKRRIRFWFRIGWKNCKKVHPKKL